MNQIGRGLFSRVFEKDGRALKCIRPGAQRPPHVFARELAILNQVKYKHPNIVSLLDHYEEKDPFDSSDDELYEDPGLIFTKQQVLVFDYYPYTLEDVAKDYHKAIFPTLIQPGGDTLRNKFPEEKAIEITLAMASGLEFIHTLGIIHRDVKPENIMFKTKDGAPVLIDFGVSWEAGGAEKADEKITDVGTGVWRAPELLFGIRDYNDKIDVWSLGCILAFLLTKNGKPFFSNEVQGGVSDLRLVADVFEKLGTPSEKTWPEVACVAAFESMNFTETQGTGLDQLRVTPKSKQLLEDMLTYSARKRASAADIVKLLG